MRSLAICIFLASTFLGAFAQEPCFHLESFDDLPISTSFSAEPDKIGLIGQKEISGIAPSIKHADHFWAISDSGNGAVLYLFSLNDASVKALFILNDLTNIDWEDLSISISPDGESNLLIPDFGDNNAKRKTFTIYQITEPDFIQKDSKINQLSINPNRYRFKYANGSRDAEAMAYDPVDGVAYIITKKEKSVFAYGAPLEKKDSINTIQVIGNVPLTRVVAADFSSDGSKFLLKTYTKVYLWKRSTPTQPFCEMISEMPEEVPYQLEPQGESICFIGDDYITVSEEAFGIKPVLYRYNANTTD